MQIADLEGKEVTVGNERRFFHIGTYGDGRPSIILVDVTGRIYTVITVNIDLKDGEFCVKTGDEEIVKGIFNTGYFEDTKKSCPICNASIWRIK